MADLTDNRIPDPQGRVGAHPRTCPLALDRARRLVARYIPADADLVGELRQTRRAVGTRSDPPED